MNRKALQARLREESLGSGGKVSLAALLDALVPVEKLRELAREHGLSPKGGFRLEKAPARVLVPLLADLETPDVLDDVCEVLADCIAARGNSRPSAKKGGDPDGADPRPALYPVLKLKEQELDGARQELEKRRVVAQGLRAKVDELTRRIHWDQEQLTQLRKELAALREESARLRRAKPVVARDESNRILSLEKELEEQSQIELQQRIKLSEQAAIIRDREERIVELEDLVPKSRKRKRRLEPPPPPERFIVPHFASSFLKSLVSKDRRAVEHAYRAVFLFCSEGSRYPGLQVKPLDPSNVWSLRASRKLRVYFRPRSDGDIDVLELLDRQEQETALRRYREK